MVYQFEGFVRRHKDGRFVESACVDPAHEPWALIHGLLENNGVLQRTSTIFITDGINIIRVASDGFRAYSVTNHVPFDMGDLDETRKAVMAAFAKGILDD